MSSLISAVAWVRRGVAAQHPEKYVLDDSELERVSALARIELEDARVELERAHLAAQSMGKGAEGDEADDNEDDGDEADWVESVISCDSFYPCLNLIFSEDEAMDIDSGAVPASKDDLSQYNLDDYDNDVQTSSEFMFSFLLVLLLTFIFFFIATTSFNIKGLTYYKDNEEDPYITLKDVCFSR